MKHIDTQIDIDATPEQVWAVLTDFARYGEWNPFVRRIAGDAAVGGKLEVVLSQEPGKENTFKPTVTDAEPGRRFSWLGRLGVPGIFDGHHQFELTALPSGGTRLRHHESFEGVLVCFLGRMLETKTRPGFEKMNQALKARVEGLAA